MEPVKIGKWPIKIPIIQGGMGVGISWDGLAGAVSINGGLGVISSVGTGYYQFPKFAGKLINGRPNDENFCSSEALKEIFKNARKKCGDAPLATNIMHALTDFKAGVISACEAGTNIIISGAGLATSLPEYTKDYPDVALVPIISSAQAAKIFCKKWSKSYSRLPDAFIVEGPKSGGHQGFAFEDCEKPEYQLEAIIPEILEEVAKWGEIPVFAAGGIWDKADIDKFIEMGCVGVQMGTRFIATHECDAPEYYKQLLIASNENDIVLGESPVGLPSRRLYTNLHKLMAREKAPKIACISNCVSACKHGEGAKKVKYCIADRLADAIMDKRETGLYFTGTNGYRVNEIISVHELLQKLTQGE
ncbi:MAG: nitronate monooxygenase [Candidatus Gracilibacteria bacterium]|nr:nitronate monooxygenase [Candidatus Gracilibacteria bacterium]